MEKFIGGIITVVMIIIGGIIWYRYSAEMVAYRAVQELPKLKETIDKQQKQIDELKRKLEGMERK